MPPIDVEIVIFFQLFWIAIICLILRYTFKLKDQIGELRSTLAPFAQIYEDTREKGEISYIFKRAFDVYTRLAKL